ncbi:MAG: hypothetical protein ACLUOI_05565 [Eisenbergiella sp.]
MAQIREIGYGKEESDIRSGGMSSNLDRARSYEEKVGKQIPEGQKCVFHLTPEVGWMNDPNGFSLYRENVSVLPISSLQLRVRAHALGPSENPGFYQMGATALCPGS